MVIREDLEREGDPAASGDGVSDCAAAPKRGVSGGAAGVPIPGFQKCPYLAGRPPCGTHHLFPSGTNVCWASPGEEKPYRAISRELQADCCFGGAEGLAQCERYQHALSEALPLPRFKPLRSEPSSKANWIIPDEHRPRRREEDKRRAHLMSTASWVTPLILSLLLLGLLLR